MAGAFRRYERVIVGMSDFPGPVTPGGSTEPHEHGGQDDGGDSITPDESVTEQSTVSRQGVGGVSEDGSLATGGVYGLQNKGSILYGSDQGEDDFESYMVGADGTLVELDSVSLETDNIDNWAALHNEIALTADDSNIYVIDISHPSNMSITSQVSHSFSGIDFVEFGPPSATGNFAFLTAEDISGDRGFEIFDYSNPHDIRSKGVFNIEAGGADDLNPAFGIDGTGEYMYYCGRGVGDAPIIDISDPTAPSKVGDYIPNSTLDGVVSIDGNRLVGITSLYDNSGSPTPRDHILGLWDISNRANPSKVINIPYNDYSGYDSKHPASNLGMPIFKDGFLLVVYSVVDGGLSNSTVVVDVMDVSGDTVSDRRTETLRSVGGLALVNSFTTVGDQLFVSNGSDAIRRYSLPRQLFENIGVKKAKIGEADVGRLFANSQQVDHFHAGRAHHLYEYTARGTIEQQYQQTYGSTVTSATTVSKWGQVVPVDTSGGAFTATLATSMLDDVSGDNAVWVDFKDVGGSVSGSNLTVETEGSETINGGSSVAFSENYGRLRVWSHDGTNWYADTA